MVGQLAPNITTEVNCESLFSQAGHQSQPSRNRAIAETFEIMLWQNIVCRGYIATRRRL